MKIVLILSLMIITLFADGFKYMNIIKNNTPIDDIVKIINNVQSGTVLRFENGTYDFRNQEIKIDNKNYISIEGSDRDKTIIRNLKIFYNNSNYTQLKFLTYNNSYLSFMNTRSSYTSNLRLEQSQISIKSSTCIVQNIISYKEYNYAPIWMDSSTVKVSKVDILNNKQGAIYAKNSNLILSNSKLSSTNQITLIADSSNLNIWENIFKNDNTFDKKGTLSYIFMTESKAIIHKNKFDNFNFGIQSCTNSTSEIFNNDFNRFTYAIIINTKAKSRILDNNISSSTSINSIGIYGSDSEIVVEKNNISHIDTGIQLNNSKAHIVQNNISSLSFKEIIMNKSKVNIINNKIEHTNYIGRADKESAIYKTDKKNIEGIPRIINQAFNFKFISDFNNFELKIPKINTSEINYNELALFGNTINGYLQNNILVFFDGYDEVIKKGTYIKISGNIIIEPKKYKGGICEVSPKLGFFNKEQRSIKVIPLFDNQRSLLKFNITSQVPLGKISLDNIALKYYETKNLTRARKIRDFNKTYILKIDGKTDKFEEVYSCKFDENKDVACRKKEKL